MRINDKGTRHEQVDTKAAKIAKTRRNSAGYTLRGPVSIRGHCARAMNHNRSKFARGITDSSPSHGENPSLRQIVTAGKITTNAIITIAIRTTNSGIPTMPVMKPPKS
jgi:hypothetical protein